MRESSDRRVAGQLLVALFHSFEEKVFQMSLEMEEIGNPSISLLPLIDQSDMLNSPPPSPRCKTLYGVIGRLAGVQEGSCVPDGVGGYRIEWVGTQCGVALGGEEEVSIKKS